MRREMTEQIEELRLKGLGYKSIALVVGTSRENVRYYCKTHDLSGDPKEVQAKLADAKKNKKQTGTVQELRETTNKKFTFWKEAFLRRCMP